MRGHLTLVRNQTSVLNTIGPLSAGDPVETKLDDPSKVVEPPVSRTHGSSTEWAVVVW